MLLSLYISVSYIPRVELGMLDKYLEDKRVLETSDQEEACEQDRRSRTVLPALVFLPNAAAWQGIGHLQVHGPAGTGGIPSTHLC